MQNNPAYGIPSEINKHTSQTTTREENERKVQPSTRQKQAVLRLSTIALILAIIAIIATLVCYVLIFTKRSDSDEGELARENILHCNSVAWMIQYICK